jgi:hypothetical protein
MTALSGFLDAAENTGRFKHMKEKIIELFKGLGKAPISTAAVLMSLTLLLFALSILACFPLILILGLQFLGFPVVIGLKSFLGSVLIMIFLHVTLGKSGNESK